jgi:hypothetical protein
MLSYARKHLDSSAASGEGLDDAIGVFVKVVLF